MALLIDTKANVMQVLPKDRAKGFTLQELYSLLNCRLVEVVHPANEQFDGQILIIDEEGKLQPSPEVNKVATIIAFHRQPALADADFGQNELPDVPDVIVGKALLCKQEDFK